ncbi:hypothetical protein L228DRAFT_76626 [Xylona heveae TC161]|uniref:Uncharacterized protein n=1 Tax=Xylona heveae (strain CBS 132557 / TC161) TaxID=1328760 RepID=A0A165IVD9_XYLHT|nr:hypothetical protein L228DRAFT_76626 [Xylona heveae TC161]KZF25441.1 hypothetical protein L228DRAFT_76626 [Xylona heveae TC161]
MSFPYPSSSISLIFSLPGQGHIRETVQYCNTYFSPSINVILDSLILFFTAHPSVLSPRPHYLLEPGASVRTRSLPSAKTKFQPTENRSREEKDGHPLIASSLLVARTPFDLSSLPVGFQLLYSLHNSFLYFALQRQSSRLIYLVMTLARELMPSKPEESPPVGSEETFVGPEKRFKR